MFRIVIEGNDRFLIPQRHVANPILPAHHDGVTVGRIVMKRFISAVVVLIGLAAPACSPGADKGVAGYKRGDSTMTLREFRPLAEQGDAKAQYNLGEAYEKGLGVPWDSVKAAKWYRKAAEQGNALAQNALGVMYATGSGVPQSDSQAARWFRNRDEWILFSDHSQ